MGKYDSLKGKLPEFEQESSFQQKVSERKAPIQTLDAPNLARMFSLARQTKKKLEAEISIQNIELEALSQLLVENFEASGLANLKLATGELCYPQTEPYSLLKNEEEENLFLKKNKMEKLKKLPWQTRNAINKERLVAGKPPMPGSEVFLKTSMRLRGGTDSESE